MKNNSNNAVIVSLPENKMELKILPSLVDEQKIQVQVHQTRQSQCLGKRSWGVHNDNYTTPVNEAGAEGFNKSLTWT